MVQKKNKQMEKIIRIPNLLIVPTNNWYLNVEYIYSNVMD